MCLCAGRSEEGKHYCFESHRLKLGLSFSFSKMPLFPYRISFLILTVVYNFGLQSFEPFTSSLPLGSSYSFYLRNSPECDCVVFV